MKTREKIQDYQSNLETPYSDEKNFQNKMKGQLVIGWETFKSNTGALSF